MKIRALLLLGFLAACSQAAYASVTIVSAFMTTAQATSTCSAGGPPTTSFPSTASAAWLYLEVSGALAGDVASVDFFDPNGKDEFATSFQPLPSAGTFCFSASINIAGTAAATLPGNWTTRVTYNGSTLTSLPFTITGSSGGSCTLYAVNPQTVPVPAAGGSFQVTVSTNTGCTWTAVSNSNFINIASGASGSGNGTVSYTVAQNTTSSARSGTMTVASQPVTINQAAGTTCAYALNPTSASVSPAGGTGSFTVSAASGCAWTATPNASWITIGSGGSGTGNGTVNYTAAASSGAARSGTIAVGSQGNTQTFTLNQSTSQITPGQPFFVPGNANMWAAGQSSTSDGVLPPSYSFAAGAGQVVTFSNVTGTASCSPQPGVCPAASGPDGVPGPSEVNAMGSISGVIDRNSGYFLAGVFLNNTPPTGTAPESLDFTNSSFTKINPKIGQVFFIGDGLSGTGTGTQQQFFVPPTATRLFLGLTDAIGSTTYFYDDTGGFNVTMNISSGATPCSYSLSPNPFPVSAAGGAETVTVNTQTGCFWSSTVIDSFITVSPNASSNGPGTMPFTVASFSGSGSRTGTVLIADQTLSVVQGSGGAQCNFSNGFASTAGLTLVGSAAPATTSDGTVLRVTPATGNQSGAAYCTSPVALGNNGTFSTQFQFRFTNTGGIDPADGITFVVATNTTGLGSSGAGIGYSGVAGNSLAIEFDTYDNGDSDGDSSNHVAIDTNGNLTDADLANVYGNGSCGFSGGDPSQNPNTVPGCMSNGDLWTANINYDGTKLTVTLLDPAEGTRFTAINGYPVNLASQLGQSTAYVGFTSGTGAGWENHDIVNWAFSNTTSLGGPPPCTYTLSTSAASVAAAGGNGTFNLTTSDSSCGWTAASDATWLHVTSPASGSGSATIAYSADANSTATSRTGHITVGLQTFTVTQPGLSPCTFTLSPSSDLTETSGGTGFSHASVGVTASASSCTWTATANASWLAISGGSPGTGSGAVNYTVQPNPGAARQSSLTIASVNFPVSQASGCTYTLATTSGTVPQAGGTGSFTFTTSDPSCPWTAATTASFLTISPPTSGTGGGTVSFSALANTTGSNLTGTITVGGQTFTVTQPGVPACTFTVSPLTATVPAAGGSGTITVTASNQTQCFWTVTANESFLHQNSSGVIAVIGVEGSGSVSYSVDANTSTTSRTGTFTIAGETGVNGPPVPNQTVTITQAGTTACSFTLGATSGTAPQGGGTGSVALTASDPSCAWSANSNVSWLMLTGVGGGTGNGNVSYTVQPNTGAARSGTLTIGGQPYTVNQAAAAPITCTFTLSPTSASVPTSGGTGAFAVNASNSSCTWTAIPSGPVAVISGANGMGNGTVGYSAGPNTGPAETATVTVGSQTFTISQAAAPPVCVVTLGEPGASAPAAGINGSVAVNIGATCQWSATFNATWLTPAGPTGGTGNGNLGYTVAANTGPARTGTIAISGQTFTVTQNAGASPCTFTLDPSSQSALAAGGPGQVLVIPSAATCAWTATSNNPGFITVTSGASGTGPAVVGYSVSPNTGSSPLNGSLTIGSVNFPITQSTGSGPACSLTLSPTSSTVTSAGGTGQVAVTAATGCAWQASPGASWISIPSGGSGNGSGTVTYTAQANTGTNPRDGTITIGSQTFTLHQQAGAPAPCTYLLNPASQQATVSGGPGSFGVSTDTGCSWNATSNNTGFLTVTSGNGNGNGTVDYTVTQNTGANSRTGTITTAGQTFTLNQPGSGTSTTNPCTYTLNPPSESATAEGGTAQVAVTAATGCSWQAVSNNTDWITITTGAAGSANGTVTYTVQANATGSARTGSMTIAGIQFPIAQPANDTSSGPCAYSLSPNSQQAAASGGTGQIAVNTATGCTWQSTPSDPSITITSGGSGAGSGAVSYSVAPNNTSATRTGTITIGTAQPFTITQPATGSTTPGSSCSTISISPSAQGAQAAGGTSQVTVTAPAGCTWTAASNVDWLTITSGGSGSGNGTVIYSVAAYTGATSRTGTLTIAQNTFTVTQSGATGNSSCTYTLNPTSQPVGSAGGPDNLLVITNTGCAWTVTSDSNWLNVTTGATGNGSGEVDYSVGPYPSGPPRTGNLTIAGTTFPVTQTSGTGPGCTFTLTPASQPSTSAGGTGQVAVTVATGCDWNATSNAGFLTVTAGGNGNGSGTLSYAVAANTAAQRTATITVAPGAVFSVTQDAGSASSGGANNTNCTYALSPTTQSALASGGAAQFTVTAATGCSWTATSNNADWLTITSGGSGSGGGTVTYAVGANSGAQSRTGTITVGSQTGSPATFTLTQASGAVTVGTGPMPAPNCGFSLNPTSGSATSDAGSAQVQVTGAVGCDWSATSNNTDWLTVANGASGGANGAVTYAFAANSGSARNGSLTIAGITFPVSQGASGTGTGSTGGTNGSNPNCSYTLNPTSQSAQATGGAGQTAVNAASGCPWTATSNAPWIAIASGASGNGAGTVQYSVQPNSGATSQTGTITVANATFQVTEAGTSTTNTGCVISLNPSSQNATANGGSGQVAVTTAIGCSWTAVSNSSWISIVSGGSGSGDGFFTYSVQPNTANTAQNGTIAVGNASFGIGQAAAASSSGPISLVSNCTYTIDSSAQTATPAGGSGQVGVTAALGCSWTTTSNADWLLVTAGGTGSGNGSVTYSASPNSGAARTGTMIVAGQNFTVTQAGTSGPGSNVNGAAACNYVATPASQSASSGGGADTVNVLAPLGCAWNAAPSADWISITSGGSGSGSGTVTYTAGPNATGASRTGSIAIAGQTVNITQGGSGSAANGCTYSLAPTAQPSTSDGGSGQVTVAAGAGCFWTATSSDPFVTITSGSGGSGNGTLTYSVSPNTTGTSRTATLTVNGQTLTVTQAAAGANGDACTYSLTPATLSEPGAGASGQVAVSSAIGCSWLATSGADWLTIIDAGSGEASGVVSFGAAPNTTGSPRTGTITIGGQTLTVSQNVPSASGPSISGVVNAASYAAPGTPGGAIAQGSYFSIFGSNLGPTTPANVSSYPLGANLAGVSIQISQGSTTVNALPHFVLNSQINAILPSNTPVGTVQITVSYQGQVSNAFTFQVSPTNWGSFSLDSSGSGPGVIQNVASATEYDLNAASDSAMPGQIEILWGTGLGPINGPDNVPPPVGNLPTPVQVMVGGVAAPISYSGRTPCCSAVDNVYFVVPGNAPLGCAVPVQVILNNGNTSNTVTMAIAQNGGQCSQ